MKVYKMKAGLLIGLVIGVVLSFTMTGCNDNEDKIKVSKEKISVYENLQQKIEISGGTGSYSCEIDDNKIATAQIAGQTLTITGQTTGTTHVTIKDGVNTPVTISVKVLDQKIVLEITKLESDIEVGNSEYYDLIIEELQELFPFPVGTRYELIIKGVFDIPATPPTAQGDLTIYDSEGEVFNGEFNLYGEVFTTSCSEQIYFTDIDKHQWLLNERLTDEYKEKYPKADIQYIYNVQTLKIISGQLYE